MLCNVHIIFKRSHVVLAIGAHISLSVSRLEINSIGIGIKVSFIQRSISDIIFGDEDQSKSGEHTGGTRSSQRNKEEKLKIQRLKFQGQELAEKKEGNSAIEGAKSAIGSK